MRRAVSVTILIIAIILASVPVVGIPEIAMADDDEVDTTLDIFGNANEDMAIDTQDVTSIENMIMETNTTTDLADANYDGNVNMLDVTQAELIIQGKDKEFTLIDTGGRTITIEKPIERIVGSWFAVLKALSIDLSDLVVGRYSQVDLDVFPELSSDLLDVGSGWTPDVEKILSLNPDVVMIQPAGFTFDTQPTIDALESADTTVLCFRLQTPEIHREEVTKLGYIFDKLEEAEAYLNWYEGISNTVNNSVEGIPEDQRVKVYFESYLSYTTYPNYGYIEEAGGIDIFAGVTGGAIDSEAVIDANPDIILKVAYPGGGYQLDSDDNADLKGLKDEIMSRPELQGVPAVKNGRVYVITTYLLTYLPHCNNLETFQIAYQAKWFYPELFEDLDPQAILQEYLTDFQGLDIDLDEEGVFVYS